MRSHEMSHSSSTSSLSKSSLRKNSISPKYIGRHNEDGLDEAFVHPIDSMVNRVEETRGSPIPNGVIHVFPIGDIGNSAESIADSGTARSRPTSVQDIPYVDPLHNVLTSDLNGSQIWLSSKDKRRLSIISSSDDIRVTPPSERESKDEVFAETAAKEWKSLGNQSLNVDHLFGLDQLNKHLPHHRLRIFVGTWNVNGQSTFGSLRDFIIPLNTEASELCDLYAVGVQEGVPEFRSWDVTLQKTIGLTHVLYASETVGTIHISIFLRRELIWFCTKPVISRYHLRLINQKNSKGFVGVFFYIFGTTVLFMTSHLTAGHSAESLDVRIEQLNRIYKEIQLPRNLESNMRVINRFDAIHYVFWFGDFNFRLEETRKNVESTIGELSTIQTDEVSHGEHMQKLLGWDQLRNHKFTSIVHDFNEHPISFLPTYKFDLNSDHYDRSSKQRTPSYTDRILFRSNGPGNPIICRRYTSVNEIKSSDHRPVYAVFDVKIRPQVRSLPDLEIGAGYFNREVYTAAVGYLRQEQALKKSAVIKSKGSSTVCNIL
ncbi:hypothetical protein RvY_04690 [Ramazzottius varieornatus]|uniref:Inositol polyphosphate-related phosphatase domain-containing protein n=1 Tax=Ramazzottius varieornatus TaxID=947166 RepID=A0A1D1UZ65_RAMVA|nr:hypothetical protein RvY_04690 [Ramazzottius varieornatus]